MRWQAPSSVLVAAVEQILIALETSRWQTWSRSIRPEPCHLRIYPRKVSGRGYFSKCSTERGSWYLM